MSKPEWNEDTPKWAEYLAQDRNGDWYWFSKKPYPGDFQWLAYEGIHERAIRPPEIDWENTLEPRP